ncbi:response regulator [Archangium sp.]|uniref:response regulator n=1 Tax=Archangium sp. TaxID=1872627 RepID=UPI003899A6AB
MLRVLVLEDDGDLRSILCELLSLSGADVCVSAGSLEELRRKGPEALGCGLALLDINLGAGVPSGLDAYRWLQDNAFPGKTVFLTGHARSHPLVREALELESVQVLSKPIGSGALLALVGDASDGTGTRQS